MNLRRKSCFTFSEMLISLTIIGILCSFYLPTLHQSYEKNTTQAGFQDTIKAMDKALFNYSNKSNCQGKLDCTNLFTDDKTAEKVSTLFKPGIVGKNCWHGKKIYNKINSKAENDSDLTDLNNLSCFIDGNGRIYATETIESKNGICSTQLRTATWHGRKHKLDTSCGYLFVDLNGDKAPNTFGRDVFIFIITNTAPSYLYPMGGTLLQSPAYGNLTTWIGTCGDNMHGEDKDTLEGRTCAGRIVEEGMTINYLK